MNRNTNRVRYKRLLKSNKVTGGTIPGRTKLERKNPGQEISPQAEIPAGFPNNERKLYKLDMYLNPPQFDNAAEIGQDAIQARGCPPPSSEECQRRWAAWHQAMELSHAMLMMGLRQKIGPEGDLQAAYRDWYERYQALKWDTRRAS